MSVKQVNPNVMQEIIDGGYRITEIQRMLKLSHHSIVSRAIEHYKLEFYVAFDEYEYKYKSSSAVNFEWTWEEDQLEKISDMLFDKYYFNLSDNGMDLSEVSKYVAETYGDILKYLVVRKLWFLIDYLKMNCSICGEEKEITEFYSITKGSGYFGMRRECRNCSLQRVRNWANKNRDRIVESVRRNRKRYRELYPEKFKRYTTEHQAKRRALDIHLGYDFSVKENEKIFGTTCVLTGDTDIAYDHFVPLNWGHVGSYNRNMYPLNQRLNSSKWAHNPFDWFEDNHERFGLIRRKFDELVTILAELNGLTTDEYRDFVYWCEANKREPEEIALDPRPSIDIWRDSMKVGDVT